MTQRTYQNKNNLAEKLRTNILEQIQIIQKEKGEFHEIITIPGYLSIWDVII